MDIELKDIVKSFGSLEAVSHVSLGIKDGELFTLLGPSGCGKTTILRLIGGFHEPDRGGIFFAGKNVLGRPPYERNIGMVFQNYALWPHMTISENVAYGLKLKKVSKTEIADRVSHALGLVNLQGLEKRFPGQLSGGQQQRVALARALVLNPDVLLLDEPLSNLDAKIRLQVRAEIRKLQKNLGITTVYVTHDQEEALVEIKDWDDLLNPKLKGQIAQCTPDRSSSSHATCEVILQTYGWEKGWDWMRKLAANTGIFTARSRDVPNVVAKGEFAVGFGVPSYMAFAEVLGGYEVKYVYPKNAYVTPEPMAVLKGAPHSKAAHAFIEFMLSEEGQKLVAELGVYPITPKYKVQGAAGSNQEKAVEFTGGMRSFFDIQVGNVYNVELAGDKKRIEDVNSYFRKEITEKHTDIVKDK